MLNAYAIGVTATLEDNVSSRLMLIVEWADKANASILAFAETARKASTAGAGMARNFEKASAAATALGDSAAGLTRASYVLDTMAASSGDLARNMAAARAEANGMRTPGGGGIRPGGGSGAAAAERRPSDRAATAAGVAGAGMAWGVYENARLGDTNIKAAATSQLPPDQWGTASAALRDREMAYAQQYAFATGGRIEPFADAMLEGSRLMRTLPATQQIALMDAAMPYMAGEAKLKGVELPDAANAFIGLAHMSGAYAPKDAAPLFEAMMQASLTTHASLEQIGRAASYALPSLHAAGANSSDVMLLIATMMQGGLLNTKSGTWLNAMASNALPNTLGSGLFSNKKQNEALHALGLYKGNQAQFYKNGSLDLMKEVAILAEDREKMSPLEFNAALKMAFGTQGARGASFFSEQTTLSNLHSLSDLKDFALPPLALDKNINAWSTVAKADQTIANANITLMNGTATLMGPVNATLGAANSAFKWTADFTKDHPTMGMGLDVGLLFGGAIAGMTAWSGAKGAAGMVNKAIIGLSKYIATTTGSLIGRAFLGMSAAEVGSASLAAIGGEVVIGAAIAGGIALALAAGLKWAMDKIPTTPPPPGWHPKGIDPKAAHGVTTGHPSYAHPHVQVNVKMDSHDVAAHVETKLIPPKSTGSTGFNPDSTPYSPSMGMYN
ncbi:MAG: hypothetical protein WCA85_25700 [Paraburkholderia sp.]|uniref:hypothetical protein n=1 Tax=Paraburkholderia sp. TaxID=1926495 RepID=UPI003C5C1FCC